MKQHDEIVFEQLKDHLGDTQFSRLGTKTQRKIQTYLSSWKDKMHFKPVDLDPERSAGFNKAWSIVYNTRPIDQRRRTSSVNITIVALNTTSGKFEAINIFVSPSRISPLQSSHGIAEILRKNKAKPFSNNALFTGKKPNGIKTRSKSVKQLFEMLYGFQKHSANQLASMTSLENIFKHSIGNAPAHMNAISGLAKTSLNKELESFMYDLEMIIDQDALKWSEECYGLSLDPDKHDQINLFNWIVEADDAQSRPYRYTALKAYTALPRLYLDETDVWSRIDKGESPVKIAAEQLSVKPSTIKKLIKQRYVLHDKDISNEYVRMLDAIDPQFWPEDNEQFAAFTLIYNASLKYSKTFKRDVQETVKTWIKNNKSLRTENQGYCWISLANKTLKNQITRVLEDEYGEQSNIPSEVIEKPDISVLELACEQYERDIADIDDMKSDVFKKLAQPLILLTFENQGFQVVEAGAISHLSQSVLNSIYEDMLPSDQIRASSYWHSPHVDVQRRFNTAVMNNGQGYKEWEPLFQSDFWEAKNGVKIYPLVSSQALSDEGEIMNHCVGGYSSNCMTNNYHIMSLVDMKGKRLSTLTVQDYYDGKLRQIRSKQHRSKSNNSPPSQANQAEREFIEVVNEGKKIKPDWQKVDWYRAEYKVNQIANQAGYDFRDKDQRQGVYEVYKPCLPRNLLKSSGYRFEGLIAALKIDVSVQDFVADFDFSQGGLVRIHDQRSTPKNSVQVQHQRPRMA